MSDVRKSSSQDNADQRTCQAIFTKVADGYTVTVSLKEGGQTRSLAESTVDTFSDAEAVAKAFASQHEFPWYKVEVSSR